MTLEKYITQYILLKNLRQSVLLKEKLNIYLYIVKQETSFCLIIEIFCQLINTIYYVFYKILEAINNLYLKEI